MTWSLSPPPEYLVVQQEKTIGRLKQKLKTIVFQGNLNFEFTEMGTPELCLRGEFIKADLKERMSNRKHLQHNGNDWRWPVVAEYTSVASVLV